MRRGVGVLAILLLLCTTACSQPVGHSNATSPPHRKSVTRIAADYDTRYDSISALQTDTQVAVIAKAESVAPDPSSPPSRPGSLVTMAVSKDLRGSPGHHLVVSELGGQPGDVVAGQVPIRIGRAYLMLLGEGPKNDRYFVLNGITGLFGFNPKTQVATRLDPKATSIPDSVSLALVETFLGTPLPEPPAPPTAPPIAGACPPGCSLPANYDAITWLASASNSVTIVTTYANPQPNTEIPILFKVDQTLEITGPPAQPFPEGPFTFPAMTPGQQYLVFSSSWRGGPCVSTLYSFDPDSQLATLVAAGRYEIPLPGRELPVPRTITLAQVRERMYPTGAAVQSTDTSESMCPE
jgi:hypothetical protein